MTEQKEKWSCCDECVFWDYKKNRCKEWFEHKIPNDPLHKCYMFAETESEE